MDKNQGYAILKAVMLENGRGFALGEHPTAPSRYVTWACYDDKDGQRQYEWGHYGNDRTAMEQDFTDRVQDYQRIYNVGIRQTEAPGLYKYYSTQRPVDIGTFPKPPYNMPDEIFNYDQRIPVENGSFLAWGYLTYTRPLTEKQASDYELRPAPDNPDRPCPIAEQMKNAATNIPTNIAMPRLNSWSRLYLANALPIMSITTKEISAAYKLLRLIVFLIMELESKVANKPKEAAAISNLIQVALKFSFR